MKRCGGSFAKWRSFRSPLNGLHSVLRQTGMHSLSPSWDFPMRPVWFILEASQGTYCSSAGDLVSQVIACPNCDKKLALSEELKGRALICPQCKGRFTVPADEPPAATFGTTADRAPSGCGSGMDFLDNLGSAPGRAAAKTAAKTATPVRPASARPATGKAAASPASRAAASRAKKIDPMMIYIGGGVAAAVLVVISWCCGHVVQGGRKRGNEASREGIFGMSDSSRHQLFNEMFWQSTNTASARNARKSGSGWPIITNWIERTQEHS